jgi:hypothetical protein
MLIPLRVRFHDFSAFVCRLQLPVAPGWDLAKLLFFYLTLLKNSRMGPDTMVSLVPMAKTSDI